jgi:hypothetical protein
MGEPAGITLAAPASLMRSAAIGIVAGVREHLEAVLHQLARRLDRAHRVGQQRLLVAQHLELHPARAGVAELLEDLPPQPRDAHRVLGAEAPGSVGQDRVARECR